MKIVVTGGRDYDDWSMVQEVLDRLNPTSVFVGDCPTGVDKMVRDWCEYRQIRPRVFVADWNKFNKLAGPIRNEEMCRKAGNDAVVVAFPGGKGTNNCVREAVRLNMIVLRVEP